MLSSTDLIKSELAETENITEPMPPSARNISNCQYVAARPEANDEIATSTRPVVWIRRSPKISINFPAGSPIANLARAKAEMIAPICALFT
ncbi:unannotated protein [freshwater metagenome]|uniref:Unannotated protein n=1 Tax=freshwater metagenome TaxID=449393 RepID=A0A6J6SCB6_9ZZZZ